jgi:uncharacterized membrane protein/osmotically-inducible protein OsmY
MNKGVSLLGGIGIGAGLMYVLDPDRGGRRRAIVRDKVVSAANRTPDAIGTTARDLTNRARGIVAEMGSMLSREEVPDWVVVERVRTKLGRAVSHPSAIQVTADRGRVTLKGAILNHEVDELLRVVSAVRGVSAVDNQLEPHREPGNIPDLQGGEARTGPRFELMQRYWSPAARFLTGAVGAGLAVYGAIRKDPLGLGLGLAGVGLLARGVTNTEFGRLVGVTGGRRGVDIQKSINIAAPVERVYRFWTNYENFPRVMTHVREVRDKGNGISHWVVDGPAGVPVEWDAVITEQIPNQVLAWKSVEGSAIPNSGVIRFSPNADDSTQVQVRLSYNPPGGSLGHSLAWLIGADPKRQMDDDLVRMKTLIETGVPPHDAAQGLPR